MQEIKNRQDNIDQGGDAGDLASVHEAKPNIAGKQIDLLIDQDHYLSQLRQARQYFIDRAQHDFTISLAGEWLLDNFYIIQQTMTLIHNDMPADFYRKLPKLTGTALAGYPRVFEIARALILQSNNVINISNIQTFLQAYQATQPLAMGELWAIPTMLRLVNLENLIWAVCNIVQIPRKQVDYALPIAQNHIETETIIANSVNNLRLLSAQNWKLFFESVSRVEHTLRDDPYGAYSNMDFLTRNRYRKQIETYVAMDGVQEEAIARTAIELAQKTAQNEPASRQAHVGYYLVDKGISELEQHIQYQMPLYKRLSKKIQSHKFGLYLAGIVSITALILALVILTIPSLTWFQAILLCLISLAPSSVIAVEFVNWLITRRVQPSSLSKMDYSEGIPDDQRAIIVIPSMLTDTEEIDGLVHQLEQHFYRNEDEQLSFAILADLRDAPQQVMEGDQALIDYAIEQIHALNKKYESLKRAPFYFFLRERLWNESEQVWMGWERKRGKLSEFNRYLLNPSVSTSYNVLEGDLASLQGIRYVITLDADTILPKDSAARLVATMAHPLNQVLFDAEKRKIISGYAVLQPRIQVMPFAATQTYFTHIFAGDTSLDLYTQAVSDVYQDYFGEGTYSGKGIYDVRAFEEILENRIPENHLLSHDLFESIHARTALVTDIVLLEDYPPHYLTYIHRLHRWIRGDWQLLPWLLNKSDFSGLAYWKIVDNLRRSLVAPMLLAILFLGWTVIPTSVLYWTAFVLLISGFPFITGVFNQVTNLPEHPNWQSFFQQIGTSFLRWMLYLAFLPHEALVSMDAIGTTISRLIRRRQLLQWLTASHTVRLFGTELGIQTIIRQMYTTVIVVVFATLLIAMMRPASLLVASPFLLTWILSLPIASLLSRPSLKPVQQLSEEQKRTLRRTARHTWLFFEQYVGPQHNWLPPDHYQEAPREIIAHLTSPTNIGLMLLSILAAHDFGYVGLPGLLARLQLAFDSLQKLERYRGHFLNWYDTRYLTILSPRYISTVDSGNLAGLLICLREGLSDICQQIVMEDKRWMGLVDTVDLLIEFLESIQKNKASSQIEDLIKQLNLMCESIKSTHGGGSHFKNTVSSDYLPLWNDINQQIGNLLTSDDLGWDSQTVREFRIYLDRTHHHLDNIERDEKLLLPWHKLLADVPEQAFLQNPQARVVWTQISGMVETMPTLQESPIVYQLLLKQVPILRNLTGDEETCVQWCNEFEEAIQKSLKQSEQSILQITTIRTQIDRYLDEMDFTFLFNKTRKIFHIGYNLESEQLDNSFYDLLASEARIASFVAIANDQVPQEHWMHLGRPLSLISGLPALMSWSGTMFEYLMPSLIMRTYQETLLDNAYSAAVNHQIAYAHQNGIPWGISESGYYAFDSNTNYQYRAFGTPDIAFKRGLAADKVIAPYATFLALRVDAQAVLNNIGNLNRQGARGIYGYYEAIDYTNERLPLGYSYAVVKEYMAHHQGMIFLSLVNFMKDDVLVSRFHADPYIESVELLLQEQMPGQMQANKVEESPVNIQRTEKPALNTNPWQTETIAPVPQVHFLSNGRYGVMINSTGGGYSQWQKLALTRWYADSTREDHGMWIYLVDNDEQVVWSIGQQPAPAGEYRAWFHPHQAVFRNEFNNIVAQMEIVVAPDDDIEIRRIRLTNHSDKERKLFYTSYAEIVLAAQQSDHRHPAFSKLFIETEYLADLAALVFHRRQRSAEESSPYMLHMLVQNTKQATSPTVENDRRDFLGRNKTLGAPISLTKDYVHFDGVASTIDPIMALGQNIHLEAHETIEFAYVTMAGESREDLIRLAQKYQVWSAFEFVTVKARYQSELELQQLQIDSVQIELFQKLLSALIYPQSQLRAQADLLQKNKKGQFGLWAYGISGDYPICLVRISEETELSLVQDLLQAHIYWRKRDISITLVILNQRDTGYTQELYNQVYHLVERMSSETWLNRHNGIFILRADLMTEEDRILLASASRVYLDASQGSLMQQVNARREQPVYLPDFVPSVSLESISEPTPSLKRPDDLLFDNGYGGFDPQTGDYVIFRSHDCIPPAAWSNVIANPDMGFTISESGGGFSWAINSSENRLSAWRNDPVGDMPSEIIYLRDEETGIVWSPTPLPAITQNPYLIRHGKGYTSFEHNSYGLEQKISLFVDPHDPIKILKIQFKNHWKRTRRLTISYYVEWVLGTLRDITQQYIIPEYDANQRTVLAHNPYSIDFSDSYLFVTASHDFHGITTDRREFLGRLNNYDNPEGLQRIGLSGSVLAGQDSCAAVQLHLNLAPDQSDEVYFILGGGVSRETALNLSEKYQHSSEVTRAWDQSRQFWNKITNSIEVETPEPSMNVLLPWLQYQALSCRIWGRSALYQSGGAFGFRDQLQDVMSVIHSYPQLARSHILLAARHQFEAGDVLHWWHPPSGRGVRTRFSDDLIWLAYVTAFYVSSTGDSAILEAEEPFLQGAPLKPDEDERYDYYQQAEARFSIYEHCIRALEKGITQGEHGLPLMGGGDWNDGMNRVGIQGAGESVWLAWFLIRTMKDFMPLCEKMGDRQRILRFEGKILAYQNAIEQYAWDGEWYLRAFYDDGKPLGSSQNKECKIDSLSQSWAVLADSDDKAKAEQAMQSLLKHLYKPDENLLLLFTPPFNKTDKDPGYIKGYPPGVRENGGQYTHAAIWTVWALAQMGQGDQAESLFQLLNPILHSDNEVDAQQYRVEPYVIAADVYSVKPYVGMGGWTWYTGSSGWMYRLGVEAILGLERQGDKLRINPCIPSSWSSYRIKYQFGDASYHIQIENPDGLNQGIVELIVDGVVQSDFLIPLSPEKSTHQVQARLGKS